jgi:Zn-finger nucleic acid-binding protein
MPSSPVYLRYTCPHCRARSYMPQVPPSGIRECPYCHATWTARRPADVARQTGAYAAPAPIQDETNDCAVRALATAAAVSYETAHAACEAAGRKRREGMYAQDLYAAAKMLCPRAHLVPIPSDARTLAKWMTAHPVGCYIVRRPGHFFAVVDGVLHDWARGTGPRSRVLGAIRLDV